MPTELTFRHMTRTEVDDLVDWAALEGWNPGLHDADTFWATDPDAYLAAEFAGELIGGGATFAHGGSIFLDAPEHNPAALRLVRRHGMTEVFGCARMYVGPFPDVAHERVFGVTTFELG